MGGNEGISKPKHMQPNFFITHFHFPLTYFRIRHRHRDSVFVSRQATKNLDRRQRQQSYKSITSAEDFTKLQQCLLMDAWFQIPN